jgi:putative colanic acid biosynthesis UDP-glucose lipid carrier transferase
MSAPGEGSMPVGGLAPGAWALPGSVVVDLYSLADIGLIVVAALAAKYFYIGHILGSFSSDLPYFSASLIVALVAFIKMRKSGLYSIERVNDDSVRLRSVFTAIATAFLFAVLAAYLLKIGHTFSRGWAILWFLTSVGAVSLWHVARVRLLRAHLAAGRLRRRVAVIGHREIVAQFLEPLRGEKTVEVALSHSFASSGREAEEEIEDSGELNRFVSRARRQGIEDVVVAMRLDRTDVINRIIETCSQLSANVRLYHPYLSSRSSALGSFRIADLTLFNAETTPLSPWEFVAKWTFDRVVAALLLTVLSPLLVVIAALIKIESRGPVFFAQRRAGLDHAEFRVLKFRTMSCVEDGPVVQQASRNDSRVTRLGNILRRTSLDELPQLINVICGEMSLVGPRPHALAHNEQYGALVERYANRHRVRPGITGWAQVNGFRGPTVETELMRKRVEYDLFYIENWSFWFDLKILILTPLKVILGDNAY